MSNDEGAFCIAGWKLKGSNWVYSDKALVHGVTDEDFERLNIAIARTDIEKLHRAISDDKEEERE